MKNISLRMILMIALPLLLWPAPGRSQESKQFALLVACDDYDEKELTKLRFTRNDILGFQNILLESKFPADNLVVMHGDQKSDDLRPNRRPILKQLDRLLEKLDGESTIIVALSGHGIQYKGDSKHYFCPHDSELEDTSSLICLEQVYNKLSKSPAKRKLLLVDACRDDPRSKLARGRLAIELESVTRPQEAEIPTDVVALFSCRAGQKSYEDPKLGHGVFFYHLLKGWHEAAVDTQGVVNLQNLLRYTSDKTQAYAATTFKAAQVPDLKNSLEKTWTLSRFSGEIRRLTGPQTSINSVQITRDGRWVAACSRGDGDPDKTNADDRATKRPELFVWDTVSGRLLNRWTIHAGVS